MPKLSSKPFEFETVQTLFQHHLWANDTIFEVCSKLSDEQLDSQIIGTYGTIRDTLEHIARAERSYLHRLRTGQRYPGPSDQGKHTVEELHEMVQKSGAGLIEIAPKIQPHDMVDVDWDDEMIPIPAAIILTQAINHASEHREQIKVMLSHMGIQPPEVDGWMFIDQFIQ